MTIPITPETCQHKHFTLFRGCHSGHVYHFCDDCETIINFASGQEKEGDDKMPNDQFPGLIAPLVPSEPAPVALAEALNMADSDDWSADHPVAVLATAYRELKAQHETRLVAFEEYKQVRDEEIEKCRAINRNNYDAANSYMELLRLEKITSECLRSDIEAMRNRAIKAETRLIIAEQDMERLDRLESEQIYHIEIQSQPHGDVIFSGSGVGVRKAIDTLRKLIGE